MFSIYLFILLPCAATAPVTEAKFGDFFGTSKRRGSKRAKKAAESEVEEEDDDDDEEDEEEEVEDEDDEEDDEAPTPETKYARKQRQVAEQIDLLEQSAVGAKTWEVGGEVSSGQRPENSLLGIPVDVER